MQTFPFWPKISKKQGRCHHFYFMASFLYDGTFICVLQLTCRSCNLHCIVNLWWDGFYLKGKGMVNANSGQLECCGDITWTFILILEMITQVILPGHGFSCDHSNPCVTSIISVVFLTPIFNIPRADSWFAPSQWEMVLLCNDISHWLSTNLESALKLIFRLWHE